MPRLIVLCAILVCSLSAQTKKILVRGDARLVQEFQSVTDKARIVQVNDQNIMQEIVDADAYIGTITPGPGARGQESEMGRGDERRRGECAVPIRRQ